MTNMTKLIIAAGVTVVGVTITTVYAKKMIDKKKEETSVEVSSEEVDDKELTFIEKIKKAAYKKVIKILAWVMLHQQQIEAVGTILSLGGAVFSIVNAIKDFRTRDKMSAQIDQLVAYEQEFRNAWTGTIEAYDKNWQFTVQKLNDIHYDMSMMHEIKEMLVEPPKKLKRA